jgi:hypothetical protein
MFTFKLDAKAKYVVLDCGHAFEEKTLTVAIHNQYERGNMRVPTCIEDTCSKPFLNAKRFYKIIKRELINMNTIKKLTYGEEEKKQTSYSKIK